MNATPGDDTLVLYYYNDGLSDAERCDVAAAISNDPTVHERYERLAANLAALEPEKTAAATANFKERLHDSIDRAAALERQRKPASKQASRWPLFTTGSLIAAALALGIGIAVVLDGDPVPVVDQRSVDQAVVDAGSIAPRAPAYTLARGLQVHLRNHREDLAGLPASSQRTALARQMVRQNRVFEKAAEQNNAQDLARVLRAFEPILLRLAADDITPAESEALQMQLAFELNVMLTKLARNDSELTGPI